jgi:shikimate 5-dehydrogenase
MAELDATNWLTEPAAVCGAGGAGTACAVVVRWAMRLAIVY